MEEIKIPTGSAETLSVCAMNATECQRHSWHGQTLQALLEGLEIFDFKES